MRKLAVICGPTASGKSALAVALAKRMGGEIVSCDAFQIYRGMDIGTAKPTKAERDGITHHLIDVADPCSAFSVSDFERIAIPAVEEISARGKLPILCGGTGFYMNAVLFSRGYGNAPADEAFRASCEPLSNEELHRRLLAVDPESAAALHVNDRKRVIRALEIFKGTGRKKSEQNDSASPRYPFVAFAYDFPRETLYARIGTRVKEMIEAGLVEEVRGLLERGVPENAQSMQAIGYKEVVEFLKNGVNLSTMSDIIEKNTRNYAKRQLTFFKKMPNLHLLPPCGAEEGARLAEEIYDCE